MFPENFLGAAVFIRGLFSEEAQVFLFFLFIIIR